MDASSLIIAPRLRAPRGGILVGDRRYRGGVFLPPAARPALEALARVAAAAASAGPVVVGIAGFSYRIEPRPIAPAVGSVAFSLHDLDRNRLHHVHRDPAGVVACDCGDYVFRRAGTSALCKHGRRLIELGLISATTPTILPPFARRTESVTSTPRSGPPRPRRFEPTPEEQAEAARLFAGG